MSGIALIPPFESYPNKAQAESLVVVCWKAASLAIPEHQPVYHERMEGTSSPHLEADPSASKAY